MGNGDPNDMTNGNRAGISNYGADGVDYFGAGQVFSTGDPTKAVDLPGQSNGTRFTITGPATSWATPFVAGIATLAWAANTRGHATTVENCLTTTAWDLDSGDNRRRVVNAEKAVNCMNGGGNLAPLVEIGTPVDGAQVGTGLLTVNARALDYESGQRSPILWTLNGTQVGQSQYGENFLINVNSTGLLRLTASATDPQGLVGSKTITLQVSPTPPEVRITAPGSDGQTFIAGLPVDFLAQHINGGLAPLPCSSFSWDGFHSSTGTTPRFTNRPGCLIQEPFPVGTGSVVVRLSNQFGQTTATRTVTLVDDGLPHVRITNPTRTETTSTPGVLEALVDVRTPVSLQAVAVPAGRPVTFTWQATLPESGLVLIGNGQPLNWVVPVVPPNCTRLRGTITVKATDADGNIAEETLPVQFSGNCQPT
jgi:hypothetical protein